MREGGLRITFDPAIDQGAWPGPLGAAAAVAGEAWLGPRLLLERLEVELGLVGPATSELERACALAARLRGRDGWWRASYEADAVGTCARLLQDRDLLIACGWTGQPAGDRLAGLWEATAGVPPGPAERARAIAAALATRGVDVESVHVASPLASLEPEWRALLAVLAASGTRVLERAQPEARAEGDLGAARAALARGAGAPAFRGDGSLALLRAHGPLAAADEVAAYLAALERRDDVVVVVGADSVLDDALARHGLPRAGVAATPASAAAVRLVLEAAFDPADPADVHALCALDPGPVPRALAGPLCDALRELPSRHAPPWSAALERGLARIADEARRERVRARVRLLVEPAPRAPGAPADRIAAAEAQRRLRALAAWARGRAEAPERAEPSLFATAHAAEALARALALLDEPEVSRALLRRLQGDVEAALPVVGEAGLAHVADPGAVLGPARVVVWWGFTRDRAPRAPRLALSRAEAQALEALGACVPDPGARMVAEAERWRRPLACATGALIWAAPAFDERGERAFPHPLWDELVAVAGDAAHALERRALDVPRRRPAPRPLPGPAPELRVGAPPALRDVESPSSLETLLGCSLAWTLRYPAKLRPGLAQAPPPPGPLLSGVLAHRVLERLLADAGAADLRARAEAAAEVELDGLCESLALPHRQVERAELVLAIQRTAGAIEELALATGARVRGAEVPVAGRFADVRVEGRADLVLDDPPVVLDLKWGASSNRAHLERGTALQLALYARLLAKDGAPFDAAYLILRTQALLGEHESPLPGASIPGPHRLRDVARAAEDALVARLDELARGLLRAPAAEGGEVDAGLVGGALVIAPRCDYCLFDALCGRMGRA